jgi:hypothetical protein
VAISYTTSKDVASGHFYYRLITGPFRARACQESKGSGVLTPKAASVAAPGNVQTSAETPRQAQPCIDAGSDGEPVEGRVSKLGLPLSAVLCTGIWTSGSASQTAPFVPTCPGEQPSWRSRGGFPLFPLLSLIPREPAASAAPRCDQPSPLRYRLLRKSVMTTAAFSRRAASPCEAV